MTTQAQDYRRDLNLELTASFRPGSRVSAGRLEKIQAAVEQALEQAMKREIPNATADVHSAMSWRYVFKEGEAEILMGAEPENVPEQKVEEGAKFKLNDE